MNRRRNPRRIARCRQPSIDRCWHPAAGCYGATSLREEPTAAGCGTLW